MRRKSTRNAKKTAEKSNVDPPTSPKKANKSGNQEPIIDSDSQNERTKNAKNITEDDTQAPICNDNSNTDKSVEMENDISHLENEKQVEDNQGTEENNDKGKSKDFINSNEQSWNTVEPETENDTVQGTAQSPSYDNDDNVQNVNDTQTNTVDKEEPEESTENQNVQQIQEAVNEPSFESEYVQNTEPQDTYEEERSTTPEIRPPIRRSISNEETKSDKKRIILRRSPPSKEKTDSLKKLPDNSDLDKDNKQNKKITLKRPTIEEKLENNTEVQEIHNNDHHEPAKEHIDLRRLSSTVEEKSQDSEGFRRKKIKLIRNLSAESGLSEDNRKRKSSWGKNDWLSNLSSSLYKIDIDAIKIVCPTLQLLKEDEVKLEAIPRERTKSEGDLIKRKFSVEKSEDELDKQSSDESSEEQPRKLDNIIAMNRKISIVEDTASKMRPPPSPAKNPKSEILFITNLVRPFTVKQLKELLERTGMIEEDGFWTDKIKSKCYVRYSSVDEAEATRNALHGINWPIGNGKQLVIDYATAEDMEKARNPVLPIVSVSQEKPLEKENKEPERLDNRYRDKEREDKRRHTPVKEFDRHKEEEFDRRRGEVRHRRSRSKSHSRERVKRYNRRSYTPDGFGNKRQKKEEPVPQKLMDDLFLKTKATPSIYWQPLSPDEIILKQKQRMVRMEEHKRRIEETRERENRERRMRESRRVPFRRR